MPDPTLVDALTAACPECGCLVSDHDDGVTLYEPVCDLSWLDVLRRLADPTWPDRGGRAPVVWISPTGNVWRGVRLSDGSWAAWPPDLPDPVVVAAPDEGKDFVEPDTTHARFAAPDTGSDDG